MFHKTQMKILDLFFEEPSKQFQIREISREINLAHTSVKIHLDDFVNNNWIKKIKTSIYPAYVANTEDSEFKLLKQIIIIKKIHDVKLIEFIQEKLSPKCIILFGSARKGEHTKNSDIDLFVESREKDIDLSYFERKLKHEIELFFSESIDTLSDELLNNIVNGVKLSGYLRIKNGKGNNGLGSLQKRTYFKS